MFLIQGKSIIADEIIIADTFYSRLIGLMGKKKLNINQGLLLKNTTLVHSCFMKIPISVVYLSNDYTVLFIEKLNPWKLGKFIKNTKCILELHVDKGRSLVVGEKVILEGEV